MTRIIGLLVGLSVTREGGGAQALEVRKGGREGTREETLFEDSSGSGIEKKNCLKYYGAA